MDGTVIDVRVFTRDGVEKDSARAVDREDRSSSAVRKDLDDQQRILEDDIYQRVQNQLIGKVADGRSERPRSRARRSRRPISTSCRASSGSRCA